MSRRMLIPSNWFNRQADPLPPLYPVPNEGDHYYNRATGRLRVFTAGIWKDVSYSTEDADAKFVDAGGDKMTGKLTMGGGAMVAFDNDTPANQNIEWRVGNLLRWSMGRTTAAETGGNAGSNFSISSWTDAGAWVKTVLGINRATGEVTVAQDPTSNLGIATKQYSDQRYGRNRIINGDFSVNQRGFTSGTTNAIGLDRWWLNSAQGGSQTATTATLGDLFESPVRYLKTSSATQTAATDYCTVFQRIESVRTLSGKTATISFWAKSTTVGSPKIAIEVEQVFGTGGAPSTYVQTYAGQVTLSTSWQRFSVTVAVPSISGKVLGSNNDDYLRLVFWLSGGSNYNSRTGSLGNQNISLDLWGVQMEEGSSATAFEQKTYAEELRACQRYYYRIGGETDTAFNGWAGIGSGMFTATGVARVMVNFPVAMRGKPTAGISGSISLHSGNVSTITSIALGTCYWSPASPATAFQDFTVNAGGTQGTLGAVLVAYTARSDATYYDVSAEL